VVPEPDGHALAVIRFLDSPDCSLILGARLVEHADLNP